MTRASRKPPTAPPPPAPAPARRTKTRPPAPGKRRASTRASEDARETLREDPPPPPRAPSEADVDELVRAIGGGAQDYATLPDESYGFDRVEPGGELDELALGGDEPAPGVDEPAPIDDEPGGGPGLDHATADRPISVAEDQLVEEEELGAPGPLAIAVHEEPAALATVQSAIATAGHTTAIAGTGAGGLERVHRALAGDVDVLIAGLPGGEPLIDAARALAPRRPVVIAAVTGAAVDGVRRAAEAGADLVAMRPHDVERLAPVLLAAARLADERRRTASARGTEQQLRARIDALTDTEAGSLQPFEMFQRVLELELKRARRYGYSLSVALFAVEIPPPAPPPGVRGILRARAGNALIHTIRDIDLATALPPDLSRAYDSGPTSDERFLVLLPYTDLTGAALLARRVIAAVAELPPVVAAGRSFGPRLIGAVAGAAPGQPLSFSRLMKDATRALEQARRDGAELAVPMPPPPGSS